MYSDEIKKLEFYKQRFVDQYLKDGKLIDKNTLQEKLDAIDFKLSIFKQAYISNGENLNIEKFHEQKLDLYEDFKILYELIYEMAQKKLREIEIKVKCELESVNKKIKNFESRVQIENLSVYGNTIYHKTNGFKQTYENGRVRISLGKLLIPSGSYIACLMSSSECNMNSVRFKLDDFTYAKEYSDSKQYLEIPGNYRINTYKYINKNNSSELNLGDIDLKILSENKYNVFCGEDKIRIYYPDTGKVEYVNKIDGISLSIDKNAEISLYVYNASQINFEMNHNYIYKSFSNNIISSPKQRQKILIKCRPGFVLDFNTDGNVYADKFVGYKQEEQLKIDIDHDNVSDFMIEEIAFNENEEFENAEVIIYNADKAFYNIDHITIKQVQISELDGDFEL